MKFSKITLENMDPKNLWVEENCIPFKSRFISKARRSAIYKDCFIYKDNVRLIDSLPKNIRIVDEKQLDKIYKQTVYMVFSDGGSFNNGKKNENKPVFGSTGTVILRNGKLLTSFSKAYPDVTNNFCELTAGLKGLEFLDENAPEEDKLVILISDSQYYMKSLNEWMDGYIKRGWKNNEGKIVKNKDILQKLNGYLHNKNYEIFTCWVRGHQSSSAYFFNEYNNQCDLLCNEAINQILKESGFENLMRG